MKLFNTLLKKVLRTYVIDFTCIDSIYYIKTDYKLIINLLTFLKNHLLCKFDILYDLSAYINPYSSNKNKFSIYYYLSSLKYNTRIIVNIQLYDELSLLKTTIDLFKSSIWLEREVWDMYGVCFLGNKDLRRLLTDYGFKYNPLLKEYPLKGYFELKYYDSNAMLQYVKVSDQQQAKVYDFKNPWKFFY